MAVLSPNRRPESLRRLAHGCVGALLQPRPDTSDLGDLPTLDPLAPGAAVTKTGDCRPVASVLKMSGPPKSVPL